MVIEVQNASDYYDNNGFFFRFEEKNYADEYTENCMKKNKKRLAVLVPVIAVMLLLILGVLLVIGGKIFVSNVPKQNIQNLIASQKINKHDFLNDCEYSDQKYAEFVLEAESSLEYDEVFLKTTPYIPSDIRPIYEDRIRLTKRTLFTVKSNRIFVKGEQRIILTGFNIVLAALNMLLKLYEIL